MLEWNVLINILVRKMNKIIFMLLIGRLMEHCYTFGSSLYYQLEGGVF